MEALQSIVDGDSWESRHAAHQMAATFDRPYSPIEITPGKYRPLTLSEISAEVKDTTEFPFPTRLEYPPFPRDKLKEALIHMDAFRQLYGPHVHILTKDMARQLTGSVVYCLSYWSITELLPSMFFKSSYGKEELLEQLATNFFCELSPVSIRLGEPPDCVAYYEVSLNNVRGDPYEAYDSYYPFNCSGIAVFDTSSDESGPVFVLAERID